MASTKHQYFNKGVNEQKRADITIDLRRPDKKQIATWTPQERKEVNEWLKMVEKVFKAFKEEIVSA